MRKKLAIFAVSIAASVVIALVVVGVVHDGDSDTEEAARGPGVSKLAGVDSNGAKRSGRSASDRGFGPERGIWPGLPPLETTALVANSNSPDSGRRADVIENPEATEGAATLLELVENFDDLPPAERGRFARRIAEGWRECLFYRPVPDEKVGERVEGRFRNSREFATAILAQAPEGPLVDEAMEEMARIDPDAVRAGIREDVLRKRHLCSGTENIDWQERTGKEISWLRKAARLGNYSAQHAFLNTVFSDSRPSGQAVQLADDKQLVLDIVAGRLQQRDLLVLERLAQFVGEGYFGPPDPMLGHSYAHATILAAEGLEQSPWHLKNPEPERVAQFIAMVNFNTRELRRVLTASELAEAEDIARKIAALEPQP